MNKFHIEELRPMLDDERGLLLRYPLFFRSAYHPKSYPCSLGAYGFQCNPGWYAILDELAARIEPELRAMLAAFSLEAYLPLLERRLQGIDAHANFGEEAVEEDNRPLLPYCTQVKEKFGGLSVYVTRGRLCNEEAWARISCAVEDATLKAATTCERCGMPGVLRKHDWLRVSCKSCEMLSRHER